MQWRQLMSLGPVFNATHGGQANPWFLILVGGSVLFVTWRKYLKGELRQGTHLGILLGISAICAAFIVTGVWRLLRHQ
jgi:hypothetical protein